MVRMDCVLTNAAICRTVATASILLAFALPAFDAFAIQRAGIFVRKQIVVLGKYMLRAHGVIIVVLQSRLLFKFLGHSSSNESLKRNIARCAARTANVNQASIPSDFLGGLTPTKEIGLAM
jgi:hypothetical protein